ncbi:hypothetical protein NOS3756_33060 [Nostoc sp. NIES-3756]|nr:hypothetical protein NOS3756_33060 [Nostoc sp. NIES-3756]BAY37919.1 hypothetical protein NIES2111_22600 [Nostoc sp. NIES-2111]
MSLYSHADSSIHDIWCCCDVSGTRVETAPIFDNYADSHAVSD